MDTNKDFDLRDFLLGFDYTNDLEVRYIPKDKPLGSTNAYLTIKETAQLSAEVGDAGAVLMGYYYRKAKTPKFDFFVDTIAAEALGWLPSKTKRTRIALVKAGWLKKITYTQHTTKAKITVFYLGKEMCSKVMTPEEYTAAMKQREIIEAKRQKITQQLGYTSWQEVLDNKDANTILDMFDALELEKTLEESK